MITITDLLAYAVALGIAAAIPGPGMTALVARSVGSGSWAGFAMLGGLIAGDLLYLSFAVFGLAMIAQHFNLFFMFVRWASIAYLLYLAWLFWTARHTEISASVSSRRDLGAVFLAGFTITLGNPKTIAFYLALLPLVLDLDAITIGSWAGLLVPTTMIVLLAVGAVFILGAVTVRKKLVDAKAQKILHRSAAVAMAGAASTMLLREL